MIDTRISYNILSLIQDLYLPMEFLQRLFNVLNRTRLFIISIVWIVSLTACQSATPFPNIDVTTDSEFTLAPDQTATIKDTGLTIKLIGVEGDQRCPSEIECAVSGPVSVSLSVQAGDGTPTELDLQTFTSNNGRAPDMQFEGMKDRAEYEGYIIRVVSVLPYPAKSFNEIKDSEYRVTFVVTKK